MLGENGEDGEFKQGHVAPEQLETPSGRCVWKAWLVGLELRQDQLLAGPFHVRRPLWGH